MVAIGRAEDKTQTHGTGTAVPRANGKFTPQITDKDGQIHEGSGTTVVSASRIALARTTALARSYCPESDFLAE